jgi:HTH-type transcriptional regulator, sugar sensing transcriptional regulator
MADRAEPLVEQLVRLGFSHYEARAYVGLLSFGEQTGYSLANLTGVPQPKIYETLHRLAERSAVVQTNPRPARYVAVAADTLLSRLEHQFSTRVRLAREEATRLPHPAESARDSERRLTTWPQVLAQATSAIRQAAEKVYLSGRSPELALLSNAVADAAARGVTFVIIHFGPLPFAVPHAHTIRHASTEGTLYASHQAHHLAVVADTTRLVWAFARDGLNWRGLSQTDDVLAALVKGYIRHDIMVQRMFADLPQQLTDLYGPGLLELANMASGRADARSYQDDQVFLGDLADG